MKNDRGEAPPSVFAGLFMVAVYVGIAGAVVAWSDDVTTGGITCGEALAAGGLALWAAAWA
jgi:hypothetical protein